MSQDTTKFLSLESNKAIVADEKNGGLEGKLRRLKMEVEDGKTQYVAVYVLSGEERENAITEKQFNALSKKTGKPLLIGRGGVIIGYEGEEPPKSATKGAAPGRGSTKFPINC